MSMVNQLESLLQIYGNKELLRTIQLHLPHVILLCLVPSAQNAVQTRTNTHPDPRQGSSIPGYTLLNIKSIQKKLINFISQLATEATAYDIVQRVPLVVPTTLLRAITPTVLEAERMSVWNCTTKTAQNEVERQTSNQCKDRSPRNIQCKTVHPRPYPLLQKTR